VAHFRRHSCSIRGSSHRWLPAPRLLASAGACFQCRRRRCRASPAVVTPPTPSAVVERLRRRPHPLRPPLTPSAGVRPFQGHHRAVSVAASPAFSADGQAFREESHRVISPPLRDFRGALLIVLRTSLPPQHRPSPTSTSHRWQRGVVFEGPRRSRPRGSHSEGPPKVVLMPGWGGAC
jgi:hypothetical protein